MKSQKVKNDLEKEGRGSLSPPPALLDESGEEDDDAGLGLVMGLDDNMASNNNINKTGSSAGKVVVSPSKAAKMKWTQNDAAKAKRLEHNSELDSKNTHAVTKKLELQRQLTGQIPQPIVTTIATATTINGNIPNPNLGFKPKKSIRAGFDNSPSSTSIPKKSGGGDNLSPDSYKKEGKIVDRYKFLKYPEADSTSILFHSLQGDLMRKFHTHPVSPTSKSGLPPLPAKSNPSAAVPTTSQSDPTLTTTISSTQPLTKQTTAQLQQPPASTTRMDSNSVTDLSAFYYHAPEPSFIDRASDTLWSLFTPKRPYFWKPDRDALDCSSCRLAFDWPFVRRHHCRRCGDVFCSTCSNHTVDVDRIGAGQDGLVRVCSTCYHDLR